MDGDMIDKTDVEQTRDDRDGDTVIKWRTRRLIRHQEDTDELSTLDDEDCYIEDMKQSVHDQKDEHLSVVMNEEMMPDLWTASYT